MTTDSLQSMEETAPSIPQGAHQYFLGLSGVGFIVLLAALVGYGVFGERITSGLNEACAEAFLDAGQKLEAVGNHTQAIQKYRQALAGNIQDDDLRFRCGRSIGDLLLREKRYGEAVAAYQELPPEAFEQAGAYTGYVTALWSLGKTPEAMQLGALWLNKAIEEENTEQELWARDILMRATDQSGDPGSALEHGQRIIALDPASDAGLYTAQVMQRQGDLTGARAQLEAFLAVSEKPVLQKAAREVLAEVNAALEASNPS